MLAGGVRSRDAELACVGDGGRGKLRYADLWGLGSRHVTSDQCG